MSVYIELESQPLNSTGGGASIANGGTGRAGATSVRRPLRGIEVSEDTYAVMKAVLPDGTPIKLANQAAYGAESPEWSNFLLQSVQESRMEKSQVLETFGESFIFFYGQHPINLAVSAILLDSQDFRWAQEFRINYERYLRGSKLSSLGGKLYLFYDDKIVEGMMMGCTLAKAAEQQNLEQLQFQLIVTNITYVSDITDQFPVRPGAPIPADIDIRKVLTEDEGKHLAFASASWADVPGLEADQFNVRGFKYPLRSYFADNFDEFTRPQEDPFYNPRRELSYWPPASDYGDMSRMWGRVNDAASYLKKDPAKLLSPKEAFNSLKKSWDKVQSQYKAVKGAVNTVTTNADAFYDDPKGYLTDKVKNSKPYKDASAWAEDAYAWGEDASDWARTAADDYWTFTHNGFKGAPDYGPSTFPPSPLEQSEAYVQTILGPRPTPWGSPADVLWLQRRAELLKNFDVLGVTPKSPLKNPPPPPAPVNPTGDNGYPVAAGEEPDPFAGPKFSVTALDDNKVLLPGQTPASAFTGNTFIPGHDTNAILALCPVPLVNASVCASSLKG